MTLNGMPTVRRDKVYVLNPDYRLRHDVHRTVLFAVSSATEGSSVGWVGFIHPLQAAFLSFFTFGRSLGENLKLLSAYFHREEDLLAGWVSGLVENPRPVCTLSPQGKVWFPRRVLVEADEVGDRLRLDRLEAGNFLWRKLDLTGRRLYTGPLQVTLMLTNRCVTHCRYCYADTATRVVTPLSTERILELVDEAAGWPVKQFNLMGGEVFLHPDWDVILQQLVERGIAPEFVSTKVPLTDGLVDKLRNTGYAGVVQVSLDACDPDILDELLGVGKSYREQVWQGLQVLDQSGLKYQVATVLTSLNAHVETLGTLYNRLCSLQQLVDWRVVPVSDSLYKEPADFKRLKLPVSCLHSLFEQLEQLTVGSPFPVLLGRDLMNCHNRTAASGSRSFPGKECSALTSHLFILPDGKATICEQLYWNPRFLIGDASCQSLAEIWDSPRARQLYGLSRADVSEQSPCRMCGQFEACWGYHNRCWADILKVYGAEHWDYPDPRCRWAPEFFE